ncbi:unnamed protein product [Ambrosiozyma monospora]|uniref:Unnamed protein product n=1 Tax=Ambrosiozyma monospora TaxID=43982 RepID=A0ACB5SSR4_AMBMO|nr:unnamed protein product [Ambrosiozyma monospora]
MSTASALRRTATIMRPRVSASLPLRSASMLSRFMSTQFRLLRTTTINRPATTTTLFNGRSNFQLQSIRKYSVLEEEKPAKVVEFAEVQKLATETPKDLVIVDVREPDEFKAGHIPNAINIPVKSSPGALGLSAEEFKLTFGFDKPDTEKTLLFYCLGGVRSTLAEELAATFEYHHRLNYVGSWADWVEKKGPVEIDEKAKAEADAAAAAEAEKAKTEEPEKKEEEAPKEEKK